MKHKKIRTDFMITKNKCKITGENTFNGDNFRIGTNHGPTKEGKILFSVF